MTCGKKHCQNAPTEATRVDHTEVEGRPMCDHAGCDQRVVGTGEQCADGHVQGNLDNYIAGKSGKPYKPRVAMVERWQTRMLPNGWQRFGEDGARAYLGAYGKGIGPDKCVLLAQHAEHMGFPAVARGFWKRAYELEHGQPAPADGERPPRPAPAPAPSRVEPRTTLSPLDEYITGQRGGSYPFREIEKRWQQRMMPQGWDQQGEAGARAYLGAYGKGIAAPKCVHLALYAESAGCPDVARGFWRKAYELEHGAPPPADGAVQRATASGPTPGAAPRAAPTVAGLPDHLQPGTLVTMQPVDAPAERLAYIENEMWWGQPKRDGERRVVMAGANGVCYQARSLAVRELPSPAIGQALAQAVQEHGPFVLDGELLYLDAAGGEHRTAAQAVTANLDAGHAGELPRVRYAIFKALYAAGQDLTGRPESERIAAGEEIGRTLAALTEEIEVLPTARSTVEKAALAARQEREGREGEVWVRADCAYVGGKNTPRAAPIVRTKYITEVDVVVMGLTPSKAADRPFGAIQVGMYVGGQLVPMGSIGTGYTRAEMEEIAQAHTATPGQVVITVGAQGTTEKRKLWQGRYRGLHLDKPPEECEAPDSV